VHSKLPLRLLLGILLLPVSIRAGTVAEFPFRFSHNLIWIKMDTGAQSKPLNFLLDTGAGSTVLNIETAKSLGLKMGGSEFVRGVNSRSVAREVEGFDAKIAGIPVRRSLLAVDLSAASRNCHQRIDGLLGADFLQGRVVQIDYAMGKIRLLGRSDPPDARAQVLPIRQLNGGLCVPVGVCGNKPQWMRLDTGCDEALLWVFRKSDKLKDPAMLSIGLSTATACYAKTGVELGGEYIEDVKSGVQEKEIFPGESGLLGNGLLSRFKVTVDMTRRIVILQRNL